MMLNRQPWIYSARVDGAFILAPALVATALILALAPTLHHFANLPVWLWGLLVVGIDVAHVYATLYRTYADPSELRQRPMLYLLTPLLCWIGGVLLYNVDALWFWRGLAYFAVFHFVRQQYGFMMIYARKETVPLWAKRLDQLTIYAATFYPLLFWHTHLPRQFDWFVAGDFFSLPWSWLMTLGAVLYGALLAAYIGKEIWFSRKQQTFNLPKNLLLLGTALSWAVGIVVFDNDLAFTALNVIAHGVPYMALIWIFCRNRTAEQGTEPPLQHLFQPLMLPLFLLTLIVLAYSEEGLWDGLVWRDHTALFPFFQHLPQLTDPTTLSWLIPLLALPQATHYALDAFIWRMRGQDNPWRATLFRNAA
jgi:hypothetical protein